MKGKKIIKFLKRTTAVITLSTMILQCTAPAVADDGVSIEAEETEAEAVEESKIAEEAIISEIEAEPVEQTAEEAASEESQAEVAVVEENVVVPEAATEESVAEEESSGEGYSVETYSETIDSGATEEVVVVDESVAEVTEDESVADPAEVTEEVTEEIVAADPVADEDAEAADGEKAEEVTEAEDEEIIEDLDESTSAPILVGSIDAGLTSSLANVGGVTVNPGAYSPYFNSQTSGGVGAGTQQYTVTQNGKTYTAYCAEPEFVGVNAPSTRTAYEITDGSFNGWGANIKKAMYYTYGAPGGKGGNAAYDKLMAWVNADLVKQTNPPTTQANLAYAYSHVIVSKAFNDMKNNTGYGGPNSLWAIGATGAFASAIGTVQDIVNTAYAQANVPAGFRVFLVPSTSERSQSFMYWSYEPTGYLKVHKQVVAESSYAENTTVGFPENYFIGKNYSPEGAVYTVYKDASCTQAVKTLTIGAGNSRADQMNTGKLYKIVDS